MTPACLLAFALLCPTQIRLAEAPEFPPHMQVACVTATVQVRNIDGVGSGVLLAKSGEFVYVLTAQHIVAKADNLEVAVYSKETYPQPRTVYKGVEIVAQTSGLADLAILRFATADTMPAFLRLCPAPLVPGQFLGLSAGCGGGEAPTARVDKVPAKTLGRRPPSDETCAFWESERKPMPGRSGGPLIDARGHLLGICSGANREKSYFTHVDEIRKFLRLNGLRWLGEEAK
jgi:S1-C subfamily serine protease